MDPYKILGISQNQVKSPKDVEKARSRAKVLFKKLGKEGKKFDAKKVLEAFQLVKQKQKGTLGEGQYKLLGRSRKERELDKHFNHQTKEIKKDKKLKKALRHARHGTSKERLHLPGDKERIPRHRRRRHHRKKKKSKEQRQRDVNIVEGLYRLAAMLPHEAKFGKAINLLSRWMKEYMNAENREHIFKVLDQVARFTFLVDDPSTRQDVIQVFHDALVYHNEWFDQTKENLLLAKSWLVSTVAACQCYTDDAFVLTATLNQLEKAFVLLEENRDMIGVLRSDIKAGEREKKRLKKEENIKDELGIKKENLIKDELGRVKEEDEIKEENGSVKSEDADWSGKEEPQDCAKEEVKEEIKDEVKEEHQEAEEKPKNDAKSGASVPSVASRRPLMARPLTGVAAPVVPEQAGQKCPPPLVHGPSPPPMASPSSGAGDDFEVLSSGSDSPVELDSDDEVCDIDSEEDLLMEIDVGDSDCSSDVGEVSSEGSVEEIEGSIFSTPELGKSLELVRTMFVDRCLAALFMQRSPQWARPKIDKFFQDIFYRRSIFTENQQAQVEAWQARIKSNQRMDERDVGTTNNPLEAQRPVIDSRETRTDVVSDSNTWAAKQTFDSRESSAHRVIR